MSGRIGYACIDLTVEDKFKTCRLKTFHEKGLNYVSELCLQNVKLLKKITANNISGGIRMYRITSDLVPWHHLFAFDDLVDAQEIRSLFEEIGRMAKEKDLRLSFHPDHFTVIASENPKTVNQSIKDLEHHSFLLDLMGAPSSPEAKINVHISNTKPSKAEAIKRFVCVFNTLSKNLRNRLTIENDDNQSGFTVSDLYSVYEQIGTPIVFDSLHYLCNPGGQEYEVAFNQAFSTWGSVVPVVHHSSSKRVEDASSKLSAHSQYIHEPFNSCGRIVDVMLEAKAKNLALFKYITDYV